MRTEDGVKQAVQRLLGNTAVLESPEDAAARFALHREIIANKPLLADVYRSFYEEFVRVAASLPAGARVELGAGGGFLKRCLPGIVTSDVVVGADVDMVCSAEALPFADASVAGLFLLDAFHHLRRPACLLAEAERCLRPGGRLVMIEPAGTWWGRLVRKALHHEAYDERAAWALPEGAHSNLALPWIVFTRDRAELARAFPRLRLVRCEPHTPFRFLLSGGVSYRSLVPGALAPFLRFVERMAVPLNPLLGLHVTIELVKREAAS